MKRLFKILLPLILIISILTGCGSASSTAIVDAPAEAISTSIILTDGLGHEVTLANPATQIVSLSPSNTELLYAVGAGDQTIGRDSFSDYPAEAADLPDIGGGYSEYNLEMLLNLEPDLVLAAEINTAELVQSIEDLGIPVFYISNPLTMDDLYTNILNVGLLSGNDDTAQQVIADIQERVAAVDSAIEKTTTTPTVFYELDATDPTKPYTPGQNTFYSTLISQAGGQNVGDVLEASWAQMSLEELLIQDPDLILLGDSVWGITPENLAEREGWGTLSAVQSGNVLPFDDNLLARPGPRLIDGLEALARVIHPEAFE